MKTSIILISLHLFLVCTCFAKGQSTYSTNCIRYSAGFGSSGGNNSAFLLFINFKGQIPIVKHHHMALFLSKGGEFYIGVESPKYEKHEMDDIINTQEIGFLYTYEPSDFLTGPYFGAGINYFRGQMRNKQWIDRIGVPIELGVNFHIFGPLLFGIGINANLNTHTQSKGVIMRIVIMNCK